MKKAAQRLLLLLLALSLLSAGALASEAKVVLSGQSLRVDGKQVDCEKYNIDGSNYFKLRDIAYVLRSTGSRFSVSWDGENKCVSLVTGEDYEPDGTELDLAFGDKSASAVPSGDRILINGEERPDLSAYKLGGNNFYKLRDLGDALGFQVDYEKETNTAVIVSAPQTRLAVPLLLELAESRGVWEEENDYFQYDFLEEGDFRYSVGCYGDEEAIWLVARAEDPLFSVGFGVEAGPSSACFGILNYSPEGEEELAAAAVFSFAPERFSAQEPACFDEFRLFAEHWTGETLTAYREMTAKMIGEMLRRTEEILLQPAGSSCAGLGFSGPEAASGAGGGETYAALREAVRCLAGKDTSREKLISQLEAGGFSRSDAVRGADLTAADWSANALRVAGAYLQSGAYSKEEMISLLEELGFTHEQAVYAAVQNGL